MGFFNWILLSNGNIDGKQNKNNISSISLCFFCSKHQQHGLWTALIYHSGDWCKQTNANTEVNSIELGNVCSKFVVKQKYVFIEKCTNSGSPQRNVTKVGNFTNIRWNISCIFAGGLKIPFESKWKFIGKC
jgi:hypothetical protein